MENREKNKKVKGSESDGVVASAGDGGNISVGEFEDVAVALNVLAAEGKKKKKKRNKRAESTARVEGVVAGVEGVVVTDDVVAADDIVVDVGEFENVAVAVHVLAAEGKKKKKKINKRDESTASVVAGHGVVAGDDVVAVDDIMVDDDVQAGEGETIVVVADEGEKENKRIGSEGLDEAGKERKKTSWEYVPIVAEVEEQLPPKRRRPQKKNEEKAKVERNCGQSLN